MLNDVEREMVLWMLITHMDKGVRYTLINDNYPLPSKNRRRLRELIDQGVLTEVVVNNISHYKPTRNAIKELQDAK
jgi:hypothetical protein